MYAVIVSAPVWLVMKEPALVLVLEIQNLEVSPGSIILVGCTELCGFTFMLLVVSVDGLTNVKLC